MHKFKIDSDLAIISLMRFYHTRSSNKKLERAIRTGQKKTFQVGKHSQFHSYKEVK